MIEEIGESALYAPRDIQDILHGVDVNLRRGRMPAFSSSKNLLGSHQLQSDHVSDFLEQDGL